MVNQKPTLNSADVELLRSEFKKTFLTRKDLDEIKKLMDIAIDEKFEDGTLVSKDDINHLPTKDEFYEKTAEILKKLDDIETSNTLLSNRVSKHSDVIEKLKKIHPSYKHS